MKEVYYPFYVLKLLGVEQVVLTNACGGINREFAPGTLMLLTDFINMMGTNPLIGPNDERFGLAFPGHDRAVQSGTAESRQTDRRRAGHFLSRGRLSGLHGPLLRNGRRDPRLCGRWVPMLWA